MLSAKFDSIGDFRTACKLDEGFLVHLMRLDLRILSETASMLVAEMGDLHLPATRWTVH